MKVPQVQPFIGHDEYEAIEPCFVGNWITEGPQAAEFKSQLLDLIGSRYGEFAPNGTLALYMALKSVNIGSGDEVIVPDFTFIATATAVVMAGATPIFVDVTKSNFQLDVNTCESVLTPRTKAIMPAHMYGMVSNMEAITKFAIDHELILLEDAAQTIGVHYDERHAGTFGLAGTFSFFADKTITTGEGGFIVTDDEDTAHNLQVLRNQGRPNRGTFVHAEIGFNFRMTDIQMAIGLAQLSKLNLIKEKKLAALSQYHELLREVEELHFLDLEPKSEIIPFRFCIIAERSRDLSLYLSEHEIEPRNFFFPLHNQPCFRYLEQSQDLGDRKFPNSIYGSENGICLPVFPEISSEQIAHVSDVIKRFYANTRA